MKGYYLGKDGNVYICDGDWVTETKLDLVKAEEIVNTQNEKIQHYHDTFKTNGETITMSDWFKFNEGLLPYIRESAEIVHKLHDAGYLEYRVNMQSGFIK